MYVCISMYEEYVCMHTFERICVYIFTHMRVCMAVYIYMLIEGGRESDRYIDREREIHR